MAATETTFMSLFMRQSGGQRVLPSQDNSEDTQQQFSRACPRSIKLFLLRDVTHVRKCTRPSPALPYGKRREAGCWPGNEASRHAHTHTNISMHIVSFPGLYIYRTSHKKVFQMKTSACRDGTLKNQPNKMETTPQHIYTIPTSRAILPTMLCVC